MRKRVKKHKMRKSQTDLTIIKISCKNCLHERGYNRRNGDLVCARCKQKQ